MLWPLFARGPRHWFLENFLLSAPGVQSVFFCCASLGAATFRRGQNRKKTPPGCFFFAPAPGKGRGRRSPVPARGHSKKKKHHPGCFFLLRPRRKAREGEAPLGAGTEPEQKKNTTLAAHRLRSNIACPGLPIKPQAAPCHMAFMKHRCYALEPCCRVSAQQVCRTVKLPPLQHTCMVSLPSLSSANACADRPTNVATSVQVGNVMDLSF